MLHQPSMANILLWSVYVLIVSYCCCLVAKSCLTLCDLMDCSPPDSSVHGISQARFLGWVVISFSRASSWPSNQNFASSLSCLACKFLFVCLFLPLSHLGSLPHVYTYFNLSYIIHHRLETLSCHGEQYLLSRIITSYWWDSSYKDKFAIFTLKGMIVSQWDYGLDPPMWLCKILSLVFLFRCFSLLFLLCIYHWAPREAHAVSGGRKNHVKAFSW